MHRVFVPNAAPPSVTLSAAETHHLTRVLRLGVGDDVAVFDGRGREWRGRIASAAADAVVDLVEPQPAVQEPAVFVTLAIGLLKGDQMDGVIRDATMLGASAIAPFVSSHVVAPERGSQARALERWTRVAVASAKQCGRAVIPLIHPITGYAALLAQHSGDQIVLCVEPRRLPAAADTIARPARALVLIGPEGGWSDAEIDLARHADARLIGLGPRTLRAETAPTVALSVLWTQWGWI